MSSLIYPSPASCLHLRIPAQHTFQHRKKTYCFHCGHYTLPSPSSNPKAAQKMVFKHNIPALCTSHCIMCRLKYTFVSIDLTNIEVAEVRSTERLELYTSRQTLQSGFLVQVVRGCKLPETTAPLGTNSWFKLLAVRVVVTVALDYLLCWIGVALVLGSIAAVVAMSQRRYWAERSCGYERDMLLLVVGCGRAVGLACY